METAARGPVICGLDVGSTKVATVIGRKTPDGVEILGVGTAPTEGMRKGSVVNVDATVSSIRESVAEAEKMTGITVNSAFVGVSGPLIKSFNSHAAISVRNEREVTDEDVKRVLEFAKAVELPNDREILHVLTQEFSVDDIGGIGDPRGMNGIRLDARVHVVTEDVPSTRNLVKCIQKAEIFVDDTVLAPLASADAVLTAEEREVGVILLDVGGGTVEMAVFYGGALRHTFVLPLGGVNITQDIAVGLRVPQADAENLKKTSGCAMIQKVRRDELVELPGVGGRQPRPIRRQYLCEIVEPRAEEIFVLLRKEVLRSGYEDILGAGIVLTGGGSLLDGLRELAERVFQMPARRGAPGGVGGIAGMTELVNSPTYSTGVGLVIYGAPYAEAAAARRASPAGGGVIERVKRFFADFI